LKSLNRGLKYIKLSFLIAKLYIFINGLFTNNKDLSSYIRFEVILTNKANIRENKFIFYNNLIY
ncbi:uncharacterized protein K444DRAFT_531059, partial [Hyaloscypha bicolor E]